MTNEKVTIPREVADAIEMFLSEFTGGRTIEEMCGVLVAEHCGQDWRKYEVGQYSALNDITTFELMRALVNGYNVEKSPEEKLRSMYEYYVSDELSGDYDRIHTGEAARRAMTDTLDILGITIEGIND